LRINHESFWIAVCGLAPQKFAVAIVKLVQESADLQIGICKFASLLAHLFLEDISFLKTFFFQAKCDNFLSMSMLNSSHVFKSPEECGFFYKC
jgi:hypothetical protein